MAENNIEKNSNIDKISQEKSGENKLTKQEKLKTTRATTRKSTTKKSSTTSNSTEKNTSKSTTAKPKTSKATKTTANTKATSKRTSQSNSKSNEKSNTQKNTSSSTSKKSTTRKATKTNSSNKIEKSKTVKESKKTDDRIKQIINEQLNNVDKFEELKEVPNKKKKDKKKIDEKQIAEQIETAKKMPRDEKKKIYKKVFSNILLGIIVTLYFIGIGVGFLNIEGPTFITDLKVFSLAILAIAIILFEYAYGKDDDNTALYGIEMLFVAIMSLVLLYTCILHQDKFIAVANIVACIGVLYYLVKSISIYIREKLKWKKTISDVKEIVSEE